MNGNEGFVYCIGLIILAISIGVYLKSAPIAFMILGGGIIVPPILSATLRYLSRNSGSESG